MMRSMRPIARLDFGSVLYFGLTALFWYSRPSDLNWLTGSLVLGGAWTAWFMWHVMRRQTHPALFLRQAKSGNLSFILKQIGPTGIQRVAVTTFEVVNAPA